jgi:prolyl oligopeptidase
MLRPFYAWLAAGLLSASVAADPMSAKDPYLWLEGVGDEAALDWVRARNAESEKQLRGDLAFQSLSDDLRAIMDSDEKIPFVNKVGAHYYNFWKDKQHQRGIWRRTTPAEYRKPNPAWEVLIDLDALNQAEGEKWVWHGARCLRPETKDAPYERCLVALSRGGADADVTREFDLVKKEWIKDGYFRPEAKGGLSWIDRDTVYVSTDFGAGSNSTPPAPSSFPRGSFRDAASR